MSRKLAGRQNQSIAPQSTVSLSQPRTLQRRDDSGNTLELSGKHEGFDSARSSWSQGSLQPTAPSEPSSRAAIGHNFGQMAVDVPRPPVVQAKLTIGQPNDKYEQEADRVAKQVISQINSPVASPQHETVQRQETQEDEEKLQRQSVLGSPASELAASPEVEAEISRSRGGGHSLAASVRKPVEQALGTDFSHVKVHTDAQSDELNQSIQSKAFTTGHNIFFRQGSYQPGSQAGQELIAHELTHVMQQTGQQSQTVKSTGASKLIQRALVDDRRMIDEGKTILLSTREALKKAYQDYGREIGNYKTHKLNSPFREKSALGLKHWAEHLNIANTGALAEIKRVMHEGGLKYTSTEVKGWERRSRLGVDTKTEPDVVSKLRSGTKATGGKQETWAEEIKGVSSADYSAVMSNIKKALKQLDKPRAQGMDFQRVVIYINNPDNPWPWTSKLNASKVGHTNLVDEAKARLLGFEHEKAAWYKLRVNGITNYDAAGNMDGKPGSWSYFSDLSTAKAKKNREVENDVEMNTDTAKQKIMNYEEPKTPAHQMDWQ